MQLFSSFLDKDGVRSLKFYYQESVMPSIDGKLSLYLILSYSNNSDLMMPNLIDDEKCQMLCEEITKYVLGSSLFLRRYLLTLLILIR